MDAPVDPGTPLAGDPLSVSQAYEVLRLSEIRERGSVWVRLRPKIFAPLMVVYVAVHFAAGYPLARVAGIAGCYSLILAFGVWTSRRVRRRHVTESEAFVGALVYITLHAVILGLTGGIRSALLPVLFGPSIGAVLTHGRSRRTDVAVGATLTVVALLAVLPVWVTGQRLAAPYDVPITVLSSATTLLVLRYTVLMFSDAHRRVGEALGRMREDAVQEATERARGLETLSAKVAHELKNPLAAIKGLVQLLARSAGEDRSRERLRVVTDEVSRMEGILRDYLSFSRPLEELRPRPVELSVLIDDVVALMEARSRDAGVRLSGGGIGATVAGDPRRLKEALINLVANALEATARGGTVEVTVAPTPAGARILVRDTGRGMTPEVLARVGTAFFTTREGGTGLGVVLAKSVVSQHGGALGFESDPGKGTRVTVSLPFQVPSRAEG